MRRFLKSISLFLGAIVMRDSSAKVVFYHDIGHRYTPMGTDADVFFSHMKCLRRGDVVCFDDGFRGIWDERERLNHEIHETHENIRVIVFLAVGLIGNPGYLTWEEIVDLHDKYGIEFQCHTWSHQTLIGPWNAEVAVPDEGRTEGWYKHELVDSKVELERRLGKKVAALCLPVGYFSDEVIDRCKAAGYEKVYASYPGNVIDDYIQPRCLVQYMSVGEFKSVLNGGMNLLKRRYLKRHKVDYK